VSGDALLVTGANGFVGSSILASWVGAMPRVALVRSGGPEAPKSASAGLTFRTLEAWTEEGLVRVLEGVGAVIHCASVVHRPDAREAEYRRFNVEGTRALVRACAACRVRRLVFMSTVKVYGEEPVASPLD
jgi:nucleoside-diphosphate-sugar epimerase